MAVAARTGARLFHIQLEMLSRQLAEWQKDLVNGETPVVGGGGIVGLDIEDFALGVEHVDHCFLARFPQLPSGFEYGGYDLHGVLQ
jgi:hypothetical protein